MQFTRSHASYRVVLAACLALSTNGAANAADAPPPTAAVAACMEQAAAGLGFNGAVEARVGGETVNRFFGTADAAGKAPVTPATRFNLGSASKMFTAIAIGRLVDSGAVQFDAPIARYLSGLEPRIGAITIAELLNHTSGLGDYFQPRNAPAIASARTATELLPLALADPPAFAPGSKRAYSNSGFVVLGAVIEKVSGLSYEGFLRREIFEPLGMRHTSTDAGAADAGVADSGAGAEPMSRMSPEGMLPDPAPVRMAPLRASPAGGMYSTSADVSAFLSALADGRLVSRATRETLLRPRADPGGGPGIYGYGFNVRTDPRRIGHGGGAPGVNAEIAFYPDSGSQLIALANRDPPVASQMVAVLEKAIFSTDPASACAATLEDPALKAPQPPMAPPLRMH